MATISEYVRRDGGTTYYVKFRLGGKQTSRPFDSRKGAEKRAATDAVKAATEDTQNARDQRLG